MITQTQDAEGLDGWSAWMRGRRAGELVPRLRLLYHGDLDRIGSMSAPGAVGFAWLTLGRNEPSFADAAGAALLPIADPQVSREQLRVRWLADAQRFEVEPLATARRPVCLVDLEGGSASGPAATPITGPVSLAPGACLAIGDRVLFGLELARAHAPGDDRIDLVGESEIMWTLRDEIRGVAQFAKSALVIGPTGAGKELVARALHRCSPRSAGPFVPVNCAALPETLAEAVLFGHRKGAFTGADAEGKGLFRAADTGTLFLDELGELQLSLQAKLLRVLQDGEVVPVGAHEGRRVDVRAIAATHRDLEAQIRSGGLREDLYHRMAAHVLRVPSLAERRFDIPELFVHVLRRLRAEHPSLEWLWKQGQAWKPALPISFIADLMRRPWTGNVRELQNLVERTARLNLEPGPFAAPDAPSHDMASREMPDRDVASRDMANRAAASRDTASRDAASREIPSQDAPGRDTAEAAPAVPEGFLRAATETLGLAHKTVLKLLAPEALVALAAEAERDRWDDAERGRRLRARAAEALLALLEAREFNQSAVAAALGTSRTTLIKLMDDLALPRATDLDADQIARAREQAGGDLDAAARLLHVSPSALKKRLTLLNLKSRG